MQAHPTETVGDSMRYHSLIGAAAALAFALPSGVAAQSLPVRNLKFDLKQAPGLAPEQYLRPASDADLELPHEQEMRLAPEHGTKSAAYKWEAGFLALSAVDAVETISCLNCNRCTEGN